MNSIMRLGCFTLLYALVFATAGWAQSRQLGDSDLMNDMMKCYGHLFTNNDPQNILVDPFDKYAEQNDAAIKACQSDLKDEISTQDDFHSLGRMLENAHDVFIHPAGSLPMGGSNGSSGSSGAASSAIQQQN